MRVLALTPSQKGHAPGQRGSIELWERVLAKEGIEIEYAPFETERLRGILHRSGGRVSKATEMIKAYGERLKLLKQLDRFDAVFVYREAALLGPAFLEKRIAKHKPLIYLLDDPLFVPYRSPSNGYLSYLKFFGKVKEIIRISKVVVVNSTQIRDYASRFNSNIWQVPSVVDLEKFTYRESDQLRRPLTVGWSGSPTTIRNVKMIEGALARITAKEECDISLIGSDAFGLDGLRYQAKRWDGATEVEELRRMHIGLVPLPADNPWNPYKFIMKTAQYMALGIVPVGTPMASNTEVIRHGENGFLAGSEDEWVDAISTLIRDDELRYAMSRQAARDAAEHYSLQANTAKIVAAFKAALA